MLLNLPFKVLSFHFTRRRLLFILVLPGIVLALLAATRVTTAIWRQLPSNIPQPIDNDLSYYTPMRTSASVYYVSLEGDDDWPGTIGQPWRTLQHAARCCKPVTRSTSAAAPMSRATIAWPFTTPGQPNRPSP